MSKTALNIFIGILLLAVVGFLGFTAVQYRDQRDAARSDLASLHGETEASRAQTLATRDQLGSEVQNLKKNLVESMSMIETLQARTNSLVASLFGLATTNEALTEENLALRQQAEEVTKLKTSLEEKMETELKSKDITIEELRGKLTVNIVNRILFDLGKAELKEEGKNVLREVAKILEEYPDRQIYVAGHTDNIPFTGRGGRFSSNWELSAGRAVAAVEFLVQDAGVNPERLAAVGFSKFHPLAENDSDDGRAMNRRIALVIMPAELKVTPVAPQPVAKPEPEQGEPAAGEEAKDASAAAGTAGDGPGETPEKPMEPLPSPRPSITFTNRPAAPSSKPEATNSTGSATNTAPAFRPIARPISVTDSDEKADSDDNSSGVPKN